jgi:hypothetical protein
MSSNPKKHYPDVRSISKLKYINTQKSINKLYGGAVISSIQNGIQNLNKYQSTTFKEG